MRFRHTCIEAMGYVLPPHIVTSDQLEETFRPTLDRLGLPPGQLEKLSGVRERRWWDPGVQPSTVAAMAGEKALQNAGIERDRIECLINTSVCRDYLEPATASMVAGKMGLARHAFCFDIANACLGFVNGVLTAANMIELGQIKCALVVDGESSREPVTATVHRLNSPLATTDTFRDNFATMTLGSGAVAAVVMHEDLSRQQHRVNGAVMRSATEFNELCLGNPTEMKADPHGLLVHGVGLAVETWPHAAAELEWSSPDQIDEFVCHQVSLSHFTHTFEQLELPLEKALLTFPYLGNVGPASMPLTLALGEAQGRITKGKELCLFAVGSGLGCIVMGVSW
ncbi:MAG TPA: 3-oxoacyl-ACP synthase III [Deltaproteobacteria bacterium]|nr:3-oxoacyl-ACP synthase III [Deltaproteobacteria bacterium]